MLQVMGECLYYLVSIWFILLDLCFVLADQLDYHLPYLSVRETFEFVHENALLDPASVGIPDDHPATVSFKNRGTRTAFQSSEMYSGSDTFMFRCTDRN
jgi:hypothetical protein